MIDTARTTSVPTMAVAVRAVTAPVLDGRTDDEIWRQARVIDEFLEYEPDEGAETRFRTEARVAYDDRNLYVLVRMYDPAPDSIVSLLARRDVRVPSEQLKLVIDSYHDRRTAYQFAVNPAGVKRDFYVYNDTNEDPSWDAVWDVATVIDSVGWVAEFRIPFSQLRFANKPEHTFGLMIVRDIARTGERISWPLYHRNVRGYVSQAGDIGGISGIPAPRRVEVTPYVVTKNVTEPAGSGVYNHGQELTGGADIKYGISSNLTLDATINPDFGQVEADPGQLNLSSFETFFEERRPFFLEGTGIFTFNTHCNDIEGDCTGLFYSRRIGREPQLLFTPGYFEESAPTSTTIVGAAKLTGRLGNGLSVGVLDAVTQREVGAAGRSIEPRTNYLVGRLQQDLRDGRSGLGMMLTAVNRRMDQHTDAFLRGNAYTGGLDLRHRFFDGNYEVAAYIAGSYVTGSAEAIAATQRSGVHRYQRPDDDLAYDPTRTSLGGDAERISIGKFGGGITRFQTVYQRFSPGFEINDVGFLSRADEQMLRNWFSFQLNTPAMFYRRAFLNFNQWSYWTVGGLPTAFGFNFNSHVELKNTWWAHMGANIGDFTETYDDRVARGGPAVRNSSDWEIWSGMELDRRKSITPTVFAGVFGSDGGRSHGWWIDPQVSLRARSRLSGSVGMRYQERVSDDQWHSNFGSSGEPGTHYTFARLDQTTVSLTTRLSLTATPNLSLQLYAQPFMSTGTYSNWRELDDPRAEDYDARYRPFDALAAGAESNDPGGIDFKQFRSNAVVRWEYRPGSTIFFVWSQGRSAFDPTAAEFSPRQDLDDLFGLHPDNTFLVKASYWFNY
ncbi:MAG: DUF5916 domain-containing protein [Gemmatimonadaceae bacterium]